MATNKGFIKDWQDNIILPITRGELVLDANGNAAFSSEQFLAKDGHPGLVTAAERAMLNGINSEGGSLADVYTKLGIINTSFYVNDTLVKFYNDAGTATPIKFKSTGDNKIALSVDSSNNISLGLYELKTTETQITQIIKSITVDKYGRVTNVTGSALTNSEIPATLTSKTLTNSTLNNCVTSSEDIGTDSKAIVNKLYVDSKFQAIAGLATSSLQFGGALSDANTAQEVLTNKPNHYYKITAEFNLGIDFFYNDGTLTGSSIKLNIGDTVIVYPVSSELNQFVYVPSGDDITTITVKKDGTTVLNEKIGNVIFNFSDVFAVTNNPSGSNTAYIALPEASGTQDGYLSKEDWATFNSYSTSLATTYTPAYTEGSGLYKIGTLTIGGVVNEIMGKNNKSALSLNNGKATDAPAYNPILTFTETGESAVNITFKGLNGIQIKKNSNTVEINANIETITQSVPQNNRTSTVKYLTVTDGYKLGVQLGSADANGQLTQDGLTDFSQFNALVNTVKLSSFYETINYSLSGSENANEYRYGNTKLKTAVTLTI